jgi:hypothetical protein
VLASASKTYSGTKSGSAEYALIEEQMGNATLAQLSLWVASNTPNVRTLKTTY